LEEVVEAFAAVLLFTLALLALLAVEPSREPAVNLTKELWWFP